jgi:DNA-binding FadR family transcriptional regulator
MRFACTTKKTTHGIGLNRPVNHQSFYRNTLHRIKEFMIHTRLKTSDKLPTEGEFIETFGRAKES